MADRQSGRSFQISSASHRERPARKRERCISHQVIVTARAEERLVTAHDGRMRALAQAQLKS